MRTTIGRATGRQPALGGYTPIALAKVPPRAQHARLSAILPALLGCAALGPAAAAVALGAIYGGTNGLAIGAGVGLVSLAASVGVALVFARRVTRPLAGLLEKAERLGGGAVGDQVAEEGPEEVRELARSLNALSQKLALADQENRTLLQAVEHGYLETLRALVNAIDAKDPYTRGHSQRTAEFAVLIARQLGLDDFEVREVEFGGLLHDIGKIGIAETILRKPARLDDDETQIMRGHPRIGDAIVVDIDFLAPVRAMVRNHHERWDGGGYPDGMRGDEIPLGARIVSCADAFDAITSDRCYQPGRPPEEAVRILHELAGRQLDPQCVEALLRGLEAQGITPQPPPPPADTPPQLPPVRTRRPTLDFSVKGRG